MESKKKELLDQFDEVAYNEVVYGNPTGTEEGFVKCKNFISHAFDVIAEEAYREVNEVLLQGEDTEETTRRFIRVKSFLVNKLDSSKEKKE